MPELQGLFKNNDRVCSVVIIFKEAEELSNFTAMLIPK